MSQKVTKEDAEHGRSCDLCGERFKEGDTVSGGRGGTLLEAKYEGRLVIVHDACLERHESGYT